jgi:hypothetical protein
LKTAAVPIKFPTCKKGEKRKANPPAIPKGARAALKIKLSGKKAEKPKTMAEQLAAASKKLEKVETKESPTITASASSASAKPGIGAPMSLAEQLQAAQAKMKKAPGQAEAQKPAPTPPPVQKPA